MVGSGGQRFGAGYQCATNTRAEQLMDLCLFTLVRENRESSETCAGTGGTGIFTPTNSARFFMACGVAIYNSWSVYDRTAKPLFSDNPPAKRLASRDRTRANKEIAMTHAVWHIIKYILPGRAADTATSLLNAYGVDVNQVNSNAAFSGQKAAEDFILSHLSKDGSNQAACYADYLGYKPLDQPVLLDTAETVATCYASRLDLYGWADVRLTGTVGNRLALGTTAGLWRRLFPNVTHSNIQRYPPRMSPQAYERDMREVMESQTRLQVDSDYQKVWTAFWADGPQTTLPAGHWQEIAITHGARGARMNLDRAVRLLLLTSVGTYEAGCSAWDQKYKYNSVRPQEFIPMVFPDVTLPNGYRGIYCPNGPVVGHRWRTYALPALNTPPFPEYPSGHSTFSSTAATLLALALGSDRLPDAPWTVTYEPGTVAGKFGWELQCFRNNTNVNGGPCVFRSCAADPTFNSENNFAPRTGGSFEPFYNWSQIAAHAGRSRIFGGYHVENGNQGGLALGRELGAMVYNKLCAEYIGAEGCQSLKISSASATFLSFLLMLGIMLLH